MGHAANAASARLLGWSAYPPGGRYWGRGGVQWPGIAAWLVGIAVLHWIGGSFAKLGLAGAPWIGSSVPSFLAALLAALAAYAALAGAAAGARPRPVSTAGS
jgi:cytosine/uracil/thiamine/allantoin permease